MRTIFHAKAAARDYTAWRLAAVLISAPQASERLSAYCVTFLWHASDDSDSLVSCNLLLTCCYGYDWLKFASSAVNISIVRISYMFAIKETVPRLTNVPQITAEVTVKEFAFTSMNNSSICFTPIVMRTERSNMVKKILQRSTIVKRPVQREIKKEYRHLSNKKFAFSAINISSTRHSFYFTVKEAAQRREKK